jgi:hypothetical protein
MLPSGECLHCITLNRRFSDGLEKKDLEGRASGLSRHLPGALENQEQSSPGQAMSRQRFEQTNAVSAVTCP